MVEIPLQLNKIIRKEVEIVVNREKMMRFEIQDLEVEIGKDEEGYFCNYVLIKNKNGKNKAKQSF